MDMLFLICAVIGSTVMVCQFGLTLLGIGDEAGAEAGGDFDGGDLDGGDFDAGEIDGVDAADDPHSLSEGAEADLDHTNSTWLFEIISLRTVIAAIAFFGLAGKAALAAEFSPIQSLLIAVFVGFVAMYAVYSMMRAITRFHSEGNIQIARTVGVHGSVYLTIPANQAGAGKITLTVQNRTMEYQAQTTEAEAIPTGTAIVVNRVLGGDLLQVSRLAEPASTEQTTH